MLDQNEKLLSLVLEVCDLMAQETDLFITEREIRQQQDQLKAKIREKCQGLKLLLKETNHGVKDEQGI